MMSKEPKRLLSLDGLRGFAVIFTISFHLLNNSYSNSGDLNTIERFISKITYYGWTGVDLFFIISGFLIGKILLTNKSSTNFFKVFYIRRFLRILPIYYLLIGSFFILSILFKENQNFTWGKVDYWFYLLLIQNYAFGYYDTFGSNCLNPTWSLAVEEQFYLIMPLIVFLFNNKKILFITLLLILTAILARINSPNWYVEYTFLTSRIDSILIGFLIALGYIHKDSLNRRIFNWYAYFLILFASIIIFLIFKSFNHTLIAIVFSGILIKTLLLKPNNKTYLFLTNKILLTIGKYSYFIYLFHQIVNFFLFNIFQGGNGPNLINGNSYLITLLGVTLTFSLAVLSFRFVEGPLMSIGKKYKY